MITGQTCKTTIPTRNADRLRRCLLTAWIRGMVCAVALYGGVSALAADLPVYELEEFLGNTWDSHLVHYPVSDEQARVLDAGYSLADAEGKEVAFQIDASTRKLSFLASLKPFEKRRYGFVRKPRTAATDLYVQETDTVLEIGNGHFAIRLCKTLEDDAGPIQSWRMPSGQWVGNSRLVLGSPVAAYALRIEQRGPVFIRVRCDIGFENGGTYELVFELQAGEPLVTLRETFAAPGDTGVLRLDVDAGFNASQILFRPNKMESGVAKNIAIENIPADQAAPVFLLEPWLHWNFENNRGTRFTLLGTTPGDVQFVMTGSPEKWVDPAIPPEQRAKSLVALKRRGPALHLDLEIKHGQRVLFIGALPEERFVSTFTTTPEDKAGATPFDIDTASPNKRSLPDLVRSSLSHDAMHTQLYQMKHSDFPLDRIKDMILDWPEVERKHPRLILNEKQLAEYRQLAKPSDKELARVAALKNMDPFIIENKMPMYLATGDKRLARAIAAAAVPAVQYVITRLTSGDVISVGCSPQNHLSGVPQIINMLDAVYDVMPPQDRRRVRAQLAFLAYLVNSPAHWDRSRGFGAMFINMHVIVHNTQAVLAAMFSDHPMAGQWMSNAMQYIEKELVRKWVDSEGRWIGTHVESPHYSMVSFDAILSILVMAKNAGMSDLLESPAMKQMGAYYAKISTPPDSRIQNWRHLPPIGNTYKFEPSGIFSVLASVYKESDPGLAAEMQWMQDQQGNQTAPLFGGRAAGFAGYRDVFRALTVEPKVPDYTSEWLNESGVILRSRYATPQENMLYLIAGKGATPQRHYDKDQGAITLWGRGEIISDDFGYNGCAPEEEQSMLSSQGSFNQIMEIKSFQTGSCFDYVQGVKGSWTRQAALVKNSESGIEYFVINDTLKNPASAIWRLWLTGKPVKEAGASLLVARPMDNDAAVMDALLDGKKPAVKSGGEGAEATLLTGAGGALLNGVLKNKTDIRFARLPPGSAIKTAIKTKTPYGINGAGNWGRNPTSQIGLVLESDKFDSLLTVVYPRGAADPAPVVTSIAQDRGFKIEHAKGTDYVFISATPVEWSGEGITFSGTVGLVQRTAHATILSLAAKGVLDSKGIRITSEGQSVTRTERNP